MNFTFLFDVRPDPVPVAGGGGLILLAFIALMFVAALIVGFVFLLRRFKRNRFASSPAVREVLSSRRAIQPSNPNQA